MRDNPFEASVTNLVEGMKAQQKSLSAYSKDVKPYRSTELGREEMARRFREPWRFYPDEVVSMIDPSLKHLSAPEAWSKLLVEQGPVTYVKMYEDLEDAANNVG